VVDPAFYAGVQLWEGYFGGLIILAQHRQFALEGDPFPMLEQSVVGIKEEAEEGNPFGDRARLALVFVQGHGISLTILIVSTLTVHTRPNFLSRRSKYFLPNIEDAE
jgi:hypothetical protein